MKRRKSAWQRQSVKEKAAKASGKGALGAKSRNAWRPWRNQRRSQQRGGIKRRTWLMASWHRENMPDGQKMAAKISK